MFPTLVGIRDTMGGLVVVRAGLILKRVGTGLAEIILDGEKHLLPVWVVKIYVERDGVEICHARISLKFIGQFKEPAQLCFVISVVMHGGAKPVSQNS